jgi:hypothetical protein
MQWGGDPNRFNELDILNMRPCSSCPFLHLIIHIHWKRLLMLFCQVYGLISHFLFLISHFLFFIFHFLFLISHFLFLISHFLFFIFHFLFLISYFSFSYFLIFLFSYFLIFLFSYFLIFLFSYFLIFLFLISHFSFVLRRLPIANF